MKAKQINRRPDLFPPVSIAGVFSFLKDTKGLSSWTIQDLTSTLKISAANANEILLLLGIQGYISSYRNEWVTTISGEDVSGSKPPRFTPETIEAAVSSLQKRIAAVNKDSKSPFEVTEAVAFGGFLNQTKTRVQAADIGILLQTRKTMRGNASDELEFMRQLRGRTMMVSLKPFEPWMIARTHRKLTKHP